MVIEHLNITPNTKIVEGMAKVEILKHNHVPRLPVHGREFWRQLVTVASPQQGDVRSLCDSFIESSADVKPPASLIITSCYTDQCGL